MCYTELIGTIGLRFSFPKRRGGGNRFISAEMRLASPIAQFQDLSWISPVRADLAGRRSRRGAAMFRAPGSVMLHVNITNKRGGQDQ